jgi:hypothetical protein
LLTILIGIMLLNFPAKRRLERSIVSRPKMLWAINWLRDRFGRTPLVLDSAHADAHAKPAKPPDDGQTCPSLAVQLIRIGELP